MGQVFTEEVSFADVARQAEVAVVVELGTPAMAPVEIPVPGDEAHDCGTYAYGRWNATIREVVFAPADAGLAVGAPIVVYPADTPDLIALTRRACVEGGSRSPIFARYAGAEPTDGARRIVLLRPDPTYGWLEVVAGAWLPTSQRGRLLKARPKVDPP